MNGLVMMSKTCTATREAMRKEDEAGEEFEATAHKSKMYENTRFGKRAHLPHSVVVSSFTCVLGSTAGYTSILDSLLPEGTSTPAWYYLKFLQSYPRFMACYAASYRHPWHDRACKLFHIFKLFLFR